MQLRHRVFGISSEITVAFLTSESTNLKPHFLQNFSLSDNTSAVHHAVILKIEKTRSLDEILQSGEYKKKIGDYQIVEYNYMGDMESALVEDSRGKKWIMSGDGFTSV